MTGDWCRLVLSETLVGRSVGWSDRRSSPGGLVGVRVVGGRGGSSSRLYSTKGSKSGSESIKTATDRPIPNSYSRTHRAIRQVVAGLHPRIALHPCLF